MKCLQCGGAMETKQNQTVRYTAVGLKDVVLVGIPVSTCRECGNREVAIPRIVELHRLIAKDLINKQSRLAAEEIRFLRKFLGHSQAELARLMDVATESVSRWESGAMAMGATAERLLRLLVAAEGIAAKYSLKSIPRLPKKAGKPARMKLRSTDTEWLAETA